MSRQLSRDLSRNVERNYGQRFVPKTKLGCSRKNPHPPRRMGFAGGGVKGSGNPGGRGGLNFKKSSAGVISTDNSSASNVEFCNTSAFLDPEKSRNIFVQIFLT